jgi:hypothetical protein
MATFLQRLTQAQNAHDADLMASLFTEDYRSEQPTHPGRAFRGRAQVQTNWSSVFAGVPDFRAVLVSSCREGGVEWGEVHWSGHHADGSPFAMRGVIIATTRGEQVSAARLYVEPVDQSGDDIDVAVDQIFRAPREEGGPT